MKHEYFNYICKHEYFIYISNEGHITVKPLTGQQPSFRITSASDLIPDAGYWCVLSQVLALSEKVGTERLLCMETLLKVYGYSAPATPLTDETLAGYTAILTSALLTHALQRPVE